MPTRALIHSFVDASPQPAWSNRPDGSLDFVNQQFPDYVGASRSEVLENIFRYIHPDDLPAVRQAREQGIRCGTAYRLLYRLRRADGVYRWHSGHIAPLKDAGGEIVGWFGSVIDIDEEKQVSEALRESEARFRAVFQSAAIGVARVEFEGARWLELNDAFCRIVGYSRQELMGQPWPEITHPEDIGIDMQPFERMARGELESYTVEKRFIHKQGHLIWARLTLSLVRNAAGQPDFEVCLMEDITARKQAEDRLLRSEARFRSLVEATSQIVWRTGPTGELLERNIALETFTGRTPEQLTGLRWLEAIHPDDQNPLQKDWESSNRAKSLFSSEFRMLCADGQWRWLYSRAVPVLSPSGDILEWVGANSDITERKQMEQELRRSNEDLQRFAYVVSHDLKEPLRNLTIFSQLLCRTHDSGDPQATELVTQIEAGAKRMHTIIRDLLVMAQPDAELPLERFHFEELARDAIASVQHHVTQTAAHIDVGGTLGEIVAPKAVVRQTLQNLLSNALKYKDERRAPRILVRGCKRDGSFHFSVSDNGRGVPPEYQHRIFDWFARVPGAKVSGSGIGLASVSRMLERVGGRIWVESELDKGSTFHFTLPAQS